MASHGWNSAYQLNGSFGLPGSAQLLAHMRFSCLHGSAQPLAREVHMARGNWQQNGLDAQRACMGLRLIMTESRYVESKILQSQDVSPAKAGTEVGVGFGGLA
ncbi:hypothetical protein VNO77_39066 [Canavalia gladiata]|uniref:Uncharacterized protein n=1 Tax=Canavalia gladiata TaxID=3824 RepID=A0AAN9PXW6_CANGL